MSRTSSASSAPSAWEKLEETFDGKTATSLHSLLKTEHFSSAYEA
jgi:hypothetical protein